MWALVPQPMEAMESPGTNGRRSTPVKLQAQKGIRPVRPGLLSGGKFPVPPPRGTASEQRTAVPPGDPLASVDLRAALCIESRELVVLKDPREFVGAT